MIVVERCQGECKPECPIISVMVHGLLKGSTGEGFENRIFYRLLREADRSLVQRFLG